LEFRRLQDRQVSRLLTLEYPPNVNAGFTISPGKAHPVTEQPASRDKLAPFIDSGNGVASRQFDKLIDLGEKERIGTDRDRASTPSNKSSEGGFDLIAAGVHYFDLAQGAGRTLHVSQLGFEIRIFRV